MLSDLPNSKGKEGIKSAGPLKSFKSVSGISSSVSGGDDKEEKRNTLTNEERLEQDKKLVIELKLIDKASSQELRSLLKDFLDGIIPGLKK